MADRMALFKAAKAQRGSGTALTKEQIKALKAEKAKAAAQAEAAAKESAERQRKHESAIAAATAAAAGRRQEQGRHMASTSGAMLPPAPRPRQSNGSLGNGSIGSAPAPMARRTESQMTRIGRDASVAPEPAGQSNASSGAVPGGRQPAKQAEERSITSVLEGFFDEPATSGGLQESVGTGELIGSNADLGSEVASALPRGGSVEAMSARSGLPNDFFEAAGSTEGAVPSSSALPAEPAAAELEGADKPGALPKGFFENRDADAKARGVPLPKKKTKEEEYAEFMAAIAADVREVETREQEEAVSAAQERTEREAFEQRLRLERIERLKRGHTELPDTTEALQSEAAVVQVEPSVLPKAAKRRRVEIKAEPSSEDEASDDEDDQDLDWRAKAI